MLGFIGSILYLLLMVAIIGYFIYLPGMENQFTGKGQTIGKKLMKIRFVKEDGSEVQAFDAFLRYIGYAVSSILALGFIWIFIDDKNQGWHDKIAKTLVIQE